MIEMEQQQQEPMTPEQLRYSRAVELWELLRGYHVEDAGATIDACAYFLGRLAVDGEVNWRQFEAAVKREVQGWLRQGTVH